MNDLWLGQRIRALRKNKRITQGDLSKALGITPQAISKWERGQALPELPLLPLLADLLGCTVDDLLREETAAAENSQAAPEAVLTAAEDPTTMQAYHLLSLCRACMREGESEFAAGRYDRALMAYTKGLRGLESFLVPGEDGTDAYPWTEMLPIHWKLYLYRSACYQHLMRQDDFRRDLDQAKEICLLTESDEEQATAFAQAIVQLGLSIEDI